MANDRNRTDEHHTGPSSEREREPLEERVRNGVGEDIRGVADEEEDDEDKDSSF